MKIHHIKLFAFGPFTDTFLDLSKGHEGLHIIYGPNEAGKSSALRAVRQMLFGIPDRSSDDFIHPYSKIRIGAVLQRSDNKILEFIRRKGRSNTLRTADDKNILDESDLRTFLGGIDTNLFSTMFGIGHNDLHRGGEEIIHGGGEIGQILFSAGSGISDLRRIQSDLLVEAEALFKPSGQKPRINEAITSLGKRQKELRGAELTGQEWLNHDKALHDARIQKQIIKDELEKKDGERNHLKRIKEALPLIGRRKYLLHELKNYDDVVILPADFSEKRRDALTQLRIAENNETQAGNSIKDIKEKLKHVDIPEPLIDKEDTIENLYKNLGSHQKAIEDRSKLTAKQEICESDAKEILRDLRNDLTLDQAELLRLDKASIVRIQELGNLYERLSTKSEAAKEEITKLSLRINRLEKQLIELKEPPDTSDLLKIIERARKYGNMEEQYQIECKGIERDESTINIVFSKQTIWNKSLEALQRLPLPSLETIDTFEHRLFESERSAGQKKSDIEELDRKLIELDGQIQRFKLEQEVPTEKDLHRIRKKRTEGWMLIHQVIERKQPPEDEEKDFITHFPAAQNLIQAYEFSVNLADDISDRLRREANRVANKAKFLSEKETNKNLCLRLKEQFKEAEEELAHIRKEWGSLWKPLEISPATPREMRVWTQNQITLAEKLSSIYERKAKAEDLRKLIETYRLDLNQYLVKVSEPPANTDETLVHLIDRGQQFVDGIEEVRTRRKLLICELEDRREETQEAESRTVKNAEEFFLWKSHWQQAIKNLGLDAEASPAEANAMISDLKNLFSKIKEAEDLAKRIQSIERDSQNFTKEVTDIAKQVAPHLLNYSVEQIVSELNSLLMHAREAKNQQRSLVQQKKLAEEQFQTAQNTTLEIHATIITMCKEAKCKCFDDLQEAENRSAKKQQLQTELNQLEERLNKLSAGIILDEFTEDALSIDPDGIDAVVLRLTEEIEQLQQNKSEIDQTIGSEKSVLSRMDGSANAAELAEEIQGILGRLEADAERYTTLRIASTVLGHAIERYREKNQGPILERSSTLFSQMTLSSFDGLRLDFDDKENSVIVGIRQGGKEIVRVEGMSEGTADQLYLAIRMASLENYLERNEPIPLIVDDILIKFDNDRAVSTLKALAQLSQRTQIIFFTHHRHLVDLAETHIKNDVLFTHSL